MRLHNEFLLPDGGGDAPTETAPIEQPAQPAPGPVESAEPVEQPFEPKKWLLQAKKERQTDPFLNSFDSIDDLTVYALNKTHGITVPGENATDQEKSEYHKSIGVPEGPDGYEIKIDENVAIPEVGQFFKDTFHKANLTVDQARIVSESYQAFIDENNDKLRHQRNEAYGDLVREMKKEYGADYPSKVESYTKSLKSFGSEEYVALMKTHGLDNHPVVTKMLMAVGTTLAEHPVHGVHSSQGPSRPEGQVLTYGDAFNKIASQG